MTKRILAISPHSDDVELGLGGYLHRENVRSTIPCHTQVVVIAQGSGSASRQRPTDGWVRNEEGSAAGQVLGCASYDFVGLAPDGAFGSTPRGGLVKSLEHFFYAEGPWDEVFIPLPSYHTDHTVTYEACLAALRMRKGFVSPRRIFAYEYPANCWGPQAPATGKVYAALQPADLQAKLAALAKHSSQWVSVPDAPYIGLDHVEAFAKVRGGECAAPAAELFYLLREIGA
ncbi:PIG-L deacetylase family protein [Roseococcus pinisoli]|uniref:PIG-L family deacetylase n=1 Tax=Roseococcus pinisoli TaxID=2835040 RepID=A0ABS5QG76_9PROT|nr:PIG-L family deacetylase [Roseococcus pinisoli]